MAPVRAHELQVKGYAHVFTWSQVASTPDAASVFFQKALDVVETVLKLDRGHPDYWSGGVEQHKDGNYHIHVGVVRARNNAVKVGRRFDIERIHPNVSPHVPTVSSKRAALSYPLKENSETWVSFEEDVEELFTDDAVAVVENSTKGGAWALALEADSYEDALDIIKQHEPKEFILRHREIVSFFEGYFAPVFTPAFKPEDFILPSINWDDIPLRNSVVIVGPPNLGKSQYALAQLGEKPLFCSHIDQLTKFKPAVHTGILLDEVSFKKVPPTAFISVLDRELPRQIHCRYKVATIPPKIKKILCTNDLSNIYPESADGDTLAAIEDRMTIMYVTQKTY